MQTLRRSNWPVALFCIAFGSFLILVACGLISDSPNQRQAPDFIVALSGLVLIIAGCMIFVGRQSRINDLLAAILCLMFGLIGAWVAFRAPSEGFSGGLPLISNDTNIAIGRWVFGIGSLMCLAISAWAFKRFYRAGNSESRADHT
jgi:uncharacterized membrane protein YphA (DoxX/SURF4 family)